MVASQVGELGLREKGHLQCHRPQISEPQFPHLQNGDNRMHLLMGLGGWSETLKHCRVCTQYVLPQTGGLRHPLLLPGGCLGEDSRPDQAGVWRVEPSEGSLGCPVSGELGELCGKVRWGRPPQMEAALHWG